MIKYDRLFKFSYVDFDFIHLVAFLPSIYIKTLTYK